MALLFLLDPAGIVAAGHEGGVEGAVLHQVLPFGGGAHLLEQIDYYVNLFKKVRATPEWQDLMKNGAFNTTSMTGNDYAGWVEKEEKRHEALMKEAGFLATGN